MRGCEEQEGGRHISISSIPPIRFNNPPSSSPLQQQSKFEDMSTQIVSKSKKKSNEKLEITSKLE